MAGQAHRRRNPRRHAAHRRGGGAVAGQTAGPDGRCRVGRLRDRRGPLVAVVICAAYLMLLLWPVLLLAQQAGLAEAVMEDSDGFLSVAYGNAALVACIELAKEVVALKAEIAELKKKQ